MSRARLFLIDGSNAFYRAYHALTRLSNSRGIPTNATYGFAAMLYKVLHDHQPDYVAIAWDAPGRTFRDDLYADYKAQRPEMPEDLVAQLPWIRRVVAAFRVAAIEAPGFEADDVIGTLARRAEQAGLDVVILSGDKDMMQLVTETVTLLDTMKDKVTDLAAVRVRFGVAPAQVADVLGLAGDAIDNVPGVPGIGEKTAIKLVAEYGSLEGVLANRGFHKPGSRLRENLEQYAEQARLSRRLATIDCAVPLAVELESLRRQEPDVEAALALFRELEFSRFIELFEAQQAPVAPTRATAARVVTDDAALAALVAEVRAAGRVAFDTETDGLNPLRARMIGLGVATQPGAAWYIPVAHDYGGAPRQLAPEAVRAALAPIFDAPAIARIAFHARFDLHVLAGFGVRARDVVADPMIAAYLLEPLRKSHGLKDLAAEFLAVRMESFAEVMQQAVPREPDLFGGGSDAAGTATFERVPVEAAAAYCGADADLTLRLHERFQPELAARGLQRLYDEVEMPLVAVLVDMEAAGVRVDGERLARLSRELGEQLARLTGEIHRLAGGEFNIDSPKQLQEVLFQRLKLPPGKKTKTGFSTDAEVLEKLARDHALPKQLLEYRSLAKLKTGYVDTLPGLIHPTTGRIHTSYSQIVATTGRLSSSDPNLQNIPIRTEAGRQIRACFVAAPGHVLLSADYSQIELRILAHLSEDPVLVAAFRDGRDIHTETAARVFGLAAADVTKEHRRQAKAINFGIIYGMGAQGLAAGLEIPVAEAERIIASYYERYPRIKACLEGLVEEARSTGQVRTMLGRIRPIPDIASGHPRDRGFAERTAKNTPIQGSAADLIKVAMLRAARALREHALRTRMLLQVHDELVFEVPVEERERVVPVVREAMEGALPLRVPLVADFKVGPNWAEMTAIG